MTSSYDRHHFVELAQREWIRAKRMEKSLSSLLVDINHLKVINARHMYLMDDRALRTLTGYLKERMARKILKLKRLINHWKQQDDSETQRAITLLNQCITKSQDTLIKLDKK